MNLIDILLLEAVRINNGKEAYELIKSNKIGVKLDPSYKVADESIIPYLDKAINNVGVNNAPFAIQLLVNKVPTSNLKEVANSNYFKDIVLCKNKPWAKQIPGYKEIIDFSSKEKFSQSKWSNVSSNLQAESKNHGKATKGSGNLKDVKELYNDGIWTLQVPISWDGEKAAAFYGKKGEKQTPTEWCTRVDKVYYDEYVKNSPLYIIRNWETGKSYQIAFDNRVVHFLDQGDEKGDEITQGDLNKIPDKLLKIIKWNGRTLLDYKKESNRTELRKGELKNPTSDFKDAEWESPKDEGNGIVSQVMHNLYNSENRDNYTTFMIQGKPFKFHKRNNYAKKFYYKNKPNYIVIAVFSKVGSIRGDILWAFDTSNGKFNSISTEKFNKEVGDNGILLSKVKSLKDATDKKRIDRKEIRNQEYYKDLEYIEKMTKILNKYIIQEYNNIPNSGVNSREFNIETHGKYRSRYDRRQEDEKVGNALPKSIGSFIPYELEVSISSRFYKDDRMILKFYITNGKSTLDKSLIGEDVSKEFVKPLQDATDRAIKTFVKEAIHDKYGRLRRSEFRERSKHEASYDINSNRKLQFEDYFPY